MLELAPDLTTNKQKHIFTPEYDKQKEELCFRMKVAYNHRGGTEDVNKEREGYPQHSKDAD